MRLSLRQKTKEKQSTRVVVTLASSEARNAFKFFRKELDIQSNNPTIREVLQETRTKDGKKSLADVLIEQGSVKGKFGVFVDGTNIECLNSLNTTIDNRKNVVVVEILSRIAGG